MRIKQIIVYSKRSPLKSKQNKINSVLFEKNFLFSFNEIFKIKCNKNTMIALNFLNFK